MEDLIKALTILLKYGNPTRPTHCETDVMYISSEIPPDMVSEEDIKELEKLGFRVSDSTGEIMFESGRYGSC